MAKQNKSTKQQNKLGSFFRKLNPNTPAKKLLAFVLIFAMLGGGYYAYRSFAATTTVKTYHASDFGSSSGITRSTERNGVITYSVISMLSTGQRINTSTETKETYKGNYRACFYYSIPQQPAKATMAFAIFDDPSRTKSLAGTSKDYSPTNGYKTECLSFYAPNSKKLTLVVATWKGSTAFTKVTIAPEKTMTIHAKDFGAYTTRLVNVRTMTQPAGDRKGQIVAEMHKPSSQILFGLKNPKLTAEVDFKIGKKYEACIIYSIGDRGSSSDLLAFYPVGTSKVDQKNLKTTNSLNTYKTHCHTFTYNGGNADAVSLHYPGWAQSLKDPYKIRVRAIRLTEK